MQIPGLDNLDVEVPATQEPDADLRPGLYVAHDSRSNSTVALRVLPANFGDEYQRDRLQRAARAYAGISDHPSLETLLGVSFSDSGQAFVLGQHYSGASLQNRPGGLLNLESSLDFAVQLADALAHAHGHGLVHRDIRPDAVLVEPNGKAVLVDWLPGNSGVQGDAASVSVDPGSLESADVRDLARTLYFAFTGVTAGLDAAEVRPLTAFGFPAEIDRIIRHLGIGSADTRLTAEELVHLLRDAWMKYRDRSVRRRTGPASEIWLSSVLASQGETVPIAVRADRRTWRWFGALVQARPAAEVVAAVLTLVALSTLSLLLIDGGVGIALSLLALVAAAAIPVAQLRRSRE